jgi:hypothetical protein
LATSEIESLKSIALQAQKFADALTQWNIVNDTYASSDTVHEAWQALWDAWRDTQIAFYDHEKEYGKIEDHRALDL